MICYVKCRVEYFDTVRSHALFVPHLCHFFRFSLLDFDLITGRCVHINGGCRCCDVHRHIVLFCNCCNYGSTDFVCGIAVCCHTVTTYENSVYPAIFHNSCRHIVADQCYVNAGRLKLESCQTCALKQRSGLVCKYAEIVATLLSKIDWSCCCTIFACCKFSCVAVCQNSVTRFYQCQTILTDGFAHADILVLNLDGLLFQKLFDLSNWLVCVV